MVIMAYAYIKHIKLFAARIISIDHKTLDNGTRYNASLWERTLTHTRVERCYFCQDRIILLLCAMTARWWCEVVDFGMCRVRVCRSGFDIWKFESHLPFIASNNTSKLISTALSICNSRGERTFLQLSSNVPIPMFNTRNCWELWFIILDSRSLITRQQFGHKLDGFSEAKINNSAWRMNHACPKCTSASWAPWPRAIQFYRTSNIPLT